MPSFTIIGRGLAGAVLYEVLRERGVDVRVHDDARPGSASRVAAGIVNPVVLRRIVPSWRAAEMLPVAERFYRKMEARYDVKLWHPLPLVKPFNNERERDEWERKRADPSLRDFLDPAFADTICDGLDVPFGHGAVRHCAWLDVPTFLNVQRDRMLVAGTLVESVFTSNPGSSPGQAVQPTTPGQARGRLDNELIHTTGPFAEHPGLVPVKGELLTVRIPGLELNAILSRNAFLLPLGDDRYRLGATFAWNDVWSGPTEEAKAELLHRLSRITSLRAELLEHHAGVRPASRDRRPIMGSPQGNAKRTQRSEFIFNGLGSRGVLLAPWCAAHLADHMLNGTPIDPEVDAARFDR